MSNLLIPASIPAGIQTAKDIVAMIVGSTDVVGVYDEDFNQLFNLARPIKANVNRPARLMDQPIENGSLTTDFRIILPVEIEMNMIVQAYEQSGTYAQIVAAFLSTQLLTVQTKMGVFPNMAIEAMPHDESADMYTAVPLALKMREVLIVDVQFQALPPEAVAAPSDQSTVQRGDQTPQSSVLFDLSQSIFK